MASQHGAIELTDPEKSTLDKLHQSESQKRASLVSNVKYGLTLRLTKGSPTYRCEVTIRFNFDASKKEGTFLDFVGKSIHSLTVNGTDIITRPNVFKSNRLHFDAELLKGENVVKVNYTNDFDHTGHGFHRFVDPVDNQEYLFTDFEPFDAHRLLPCFDQPSIKGELELEVHAPNDWEVFTCGATTNSAGAGGQTIHKAVATKPISTYVYAIVAGPYHVYSNSVTTRGVEIPLRIACRKSLTQYIEADLEELFTVTKQGFQFYTEFFDFPYPFGKYDQIFVPEYNSGAMENVGCVTFNESMVYREPSTIPRRIRRADTFLHELAHMWFGNLVSPVWWDGLWLNESFATFMASYSLSKATKFAGNMAWQEFNRDMKRWAEREDQLSTTHPIQGVVADTDATFLNFDGITYGKGACVLKQLMAVIGEESFKAGMIYYFKKFQYGNTTQIDFLKSLEQGYRSVVKGSTIDLIEWSKLWLDTAGLNTLTPRIKYTGNKISEFVVVQTADAVTPTLRPHTIEIALFYKDSEGIPKLKQTLRVNIDGAETEIAALRDVDAPDFVFLNYEDLAYAKIILDDRSLNYVLQNVEKFDNSLLRQLIWGTIYHMQRDAKMPATKLLQLVRDKIKYEENVNLISSILETAGGSVAYYLPEDMYQAEAKKMFAFSLEMLKDATADAKIIWAKNLIGMAKDEESVCKLVELMDSNSLVEFDQEMRWSILVKAASYNMDGIDKRLEEEEKRDSSDRGQRKVLTAKYSKPDINLKKEAWEKMMNVEGSSRYTLVAIMSGFRHRHQRELIREYEDKYFSMLKDIFRAHRRFADDFASQLSPSFPDDDSLTKRFEELLETLNETEDLRCRHHVKTELDAIRRQKKGRDLVRSASKL
eukprot:TRINITY_DN4261_c0_g1_i1.p1 TRINITY_DN4261_c0_g1~~TRINITY_DN4261_c0_g1_i1.p1  ORF type:complete len:938 (-),score=207.99 TRINITY_DN4261_c0_g1_i1:783-3416(-)